MGKQFILSVPNYTYSESLGTFIKTQLKMELGSVGCGSTEFYSKRKPKFFKKKIIENFGNVTWNNIIDTYYEEEK